MKRIGFTLTLVLCLAPSLPAIVAPPAGEVLPPLDVRDPAALAARGPAGPQVAGVRRNPVTGLAARVFQQGRPLSTPRPGIEPATAAREFLRERRDLFGFDEAAVASLAVARVVPDAESGTTHVTFLQRHLGVPVYGGQIRVSMRRDGAVLMAGAGDAVARPLAAGDWTIAPEAALAAASAGAGVAASWTPRLLGFAPGGGTSWDGGPFRRPVTLERIWFPVPSPSGGPVLVPAWMARLHVSSQAAYEIVVDARTGDLLRRFNRVLFVATRGLVFERDPNLGPQVWTPFPDPISRIAPESPIGWCTETATPPLFAVETIGNNTDTKLDELDDDETTVEARAPGSGPGLPWDPVTFDYPFVNNPDLDRDAALTSLFAFVNSAHDRFLQLGFDEASGNMQGSNFGRGGVGGDAVFADDRDGGGVCNANFLTFEDGSEARMQMYLWYQNCQGPSGTIRYGSLDGTIVVHEYTHGVTLRLVGTPCLFGMQSIGMGEGWSDYFGGSFFDVPVNGGYATFDRDNGVRSQPMTAPVRRYTYGEICTILGGTCEEHDVGEVWAQNLWDMRTGLQAAYGAEAGAEFSDRLVLLGLKFTPCGPTFVDARDAILAADVALTGGMNACLIWEAFARGGVGFNASSVDDADQNPVQDFTTPPFCQGTGSMQWDRGTYLCEDGATITVQDSNATAGENVTVSTSNAVPDAETFPLAGTGPAWVIGPFPVSAGPAVPGDGILQVTEGDLLIASYTDASTAGVVTVTAVADCTANVTVSARIVEESCDDDSVAGFPALPRFLDPGETVTLRVDLRDANEGPLRNVEVTLTTTNPDITIQPAGPVPVGELPAPTGGKAEPRTLDFLLYAAPTAAAGTTADFLLNLTADGAVRAAGDSFSLDIGYDYSVVPQSVSWDFEADEQGWTHEANFPGGADEWGRVASEGGNGTSASWRNKGAGGIPGGYTDAQDEPHVISSAIPVLPGTVAFRGAELRFWHNVDLRSTSFGGYSIDVDGVFVTLQNPPFTLDTGNPFDVFSKVLAGYANAPAFGFDSNTGGAWVQQVVPVPPEYSVALDAAQPLHLAWYFWPDVTDAFFPCTNPFCEAAGGRYSFDEVAFDYELVQMVLQAAACTPDTPSVLARPAGDLVGPVCTGDVVTLDASASVAINCPSGLLYEWTDSQGNPVGNGPTYDATAVTNTTYTVVVTCPDAPGDSDTQTWTVWLQCGMTASIAPPAALLCPGDPLLLDGSATADLLCGAPVASRWLGPGQPADPPFLPAQLTLDTTVPAAASTLFTLQAHRENDPDCFDQAEVEIVADCTLAPAAAADPATAVCAGTTVTLDAAGSAIQNCGGTLEYEWSGPDIAAPAFGTDPALAITAGAGGTHTVTMRRTDWTDCSTTADVEVLIDDGFSAGSIGPSLRVRRALNGAIPTADLDLAWDGSTLSPESYTVVRDASAQIVAGLPGQPENAAVEIATGLAARQATDAGAIGGTNAAVWYYSVLGKNRCTRDYIDP